jgi:hypothetical protein
LVLAELEPHTTKPAAEKLQFLKTGHYLQPQVEDFLTDSGVLLPAREAEGIYTHPDQSFQIIGHVDGVIDMEGDGPAPFALLEVKAVRHHNYLKLKATTDWREKYGHYEPQAQCYLHFEELETPATPVLEAGKEAGLFSGECTHKGPFAATYFVFMDRDNSDMMGGIPVEGPSYTYRPDMVLEPNRDFFEELLDKHERAAEMIETKEVPEYCDQKGWCFFCGKGMPKLDPRG